MTKNWAEINEVSAAMFGVVAEGYVEGLRPRLGYQIEVGGGCWVDHRDICSCIRDAVVMLSGDVDGEGARI